MILVTEIRDRETEYPWTGGIVGLQIKNHVAVAEEHVGIGGQDFIGTRHTKTHAQAVKGLSRKPVARVATSASDNRRYC